MHLLFATGNQHKLEEIQALLEGVAQLSTPGEWGVVGEIPEDQSTLEGNALQKARYIYAKTGQGCFADDTGLEVEALGGEPGVYSARYATLQGVGTGDTSEDNMTLLLRRLDGKSNRRARFRTVIALILGGEQGGEEHLFEGAVEGEITCERSGVAGFGYDPIFRPAGYTETFAQMPLALKNSISHRAQAAARLVRFLQTLRA